MAVSFPTYCTREDVKSALDIAEVARSNDRVDRAIESATTAVDRLCRVRLTPTHATRYFDWPDIRYPVPWRLWLDADRLIALDSVVAGGVTLTGIHLEPINLGPPYTRLEPDRASTSMFQSGPSIQRSIAVTGIFGHTDDAETVGTLFADLAADITATATVTWATARLGVGNLLRIGDERMLIAERTMSPANQTLVTPLTNSAANVTVAVNSGAAFEVGETILLDSERMLVVDIAGNNLTVKRAFDGTVLAAHSGSAIYALTGITLGRAQAGTTLAAHTSGDTITRWLVPPLARDLAVAYSLNQLLQEQAGWARTAGSADNQQNISGQGIADLERATREAYGRQVRAGAI